MRRQSGWCRCSAPMPEETGAKGALSSVRSGQSSFLDASRHPLFHDALFGTVHRVAGVGNSMSAGANSIIVPTAWFPALELTRLPASFRRHGARADLSKRQCPVLHEIRAAN